MDGYQGNDDYTPHQKQHYWAHETPGHFPGNAIIRGDERLKVFKQSFRGSVVTS